MIDFPVFIGGCERSGTTLLGSLLGGHSQCVTTPESPFKVALLKAVASESDSADPQRFGRLVADNWRFQLWDVAIGGLQLAEGQGPPDVSVARLLEQIVTAYSARHQRPNARIWVDHTPRNVRHTLALRRIFPRAKFIHIVRDGRAVAASTMPLDWGPNTIVSAAQWWAMNVSFGLAAEQMLDQQSLLRIRFEKLVSDPTSELRRLCRFLGLEFESHMLDGDGFCVPSYTRAQHRLIGLPPQPDRALSWRTSLSDREVEIFEQVTGDLLPLLGYSLEFGLAARAPAPLERLGMSAVELLKSAANPVRMWLRRRRTLGRPAPAPTPAPAWGRERPAPRPTPVPAGSWAGGARTALEGPDC